MVLIVYVDDIILRGNDETGLAFVKKKLADDFQIKDLGTLKYFQVQKWHSCQPKEVYTSSTYTNMFAWLC